LSEEVSIIKTVERIFCNLVQAQPFDFIAQDAAIVQASEVRAVTPAFMQETNKLHSLALCAALLEAVYDVQHIRLQSQAIAPVKFALNCSGKG
jgi:hypothetical protein